MKIVSAAALWLVLILFAAVVAVWSETVATAAVTAGLSAAAATPEKKNLMIRSCILVRIRTRTDRTEIQPYHNRVLRKSTGLSSSHFLSDFPTKTLPAFLPHVPQAPPIHLSPQYLLRSTNHQIPCYTIFSCYFHLHSYIFLSNLFSDTLSQCSFLNVRHQSSGYNSNKLEFQSCEFYHYQ